MSSYDSATYQRHRRDVHSCYSGASALLININEPFDKSAFKSFIEESANNGMSGVIVAFVENMKRLAVAITYGPLTTGQVLRTAVDQVLPSPFTARDVRPRGDRGSRNRLVRDFEASDRVWNVKATTPVRRIHICAKTLTNKEVCISHTQKTRMPSCSL